MVEGRAAIPVWFKPSQTQYSHFLSSWDEVRSLFEGLSIPEAIDRFSNKENKVIELSSAEFSATAKKQFEIQIENLEARFKLVADLNQELTSKLGELKENYEAELTEKLKALQLKEEEVTSLTTSLDSAKAEASARTDELKTSQMALVVYKGGEDVRYKERATAMIESTEFNRPIRWLENMGFSRLLHNLYTENEQLKSENKGLRQQVIELSSTEFSATAKKQFEIQIENLEARFKLVADLNQELTSKLGELKENYEAELAEKLKALQLKEEEVASLTTSLDSAKAEASARTDELKTSQMALVVYKGGEDVRYKERATAMIESTEFNRPIKICRFHVRVLNAT
ncbi:uncharacterized protein LOC121986508 [Zingiber officinale]|uniref:uncharacterized protein LOC121986508 n=1 Tax=Zingiber officinale TaxID=94328 RepID=UPI001C4A877F|nr:uncharacterized protein LOC121986508 [Zingiber officinale]